MSILFCLTFFGFHLMFSCFKYQMADSRCDGRGRAILPARQRRSTHGSPLLPGTPTHTHTHTHTHTRTHTRTHTYTHTHIHTHTHTHTHMVVCMYVCMYVWMDGLMYVCMHVWMDGCAIAHAHTYTHTTPTPTPHSHPHQTHTDIHQRTIDLSEKEAHPRYLATTAKACPSAWRWACPICMAMGMCQEVTLCPDPDFWPRF